MARRIAWLGLILYAAVILALRWAGNDQAAVAVRDITNFGMGWAAYIVFLMWLLEAFDLRRR